MGWRRAAGPARPWGGPARPGASRRVAQGIQDSAPPQAATMFCFESAATMERARRGGASAGPRPGGAGAEPIARQRDPEAPPVRRRRMSSLRGRLLKVEGRRAGGAAFVMQLGQARRARSARGACRAVSPTRGSARWDTDAAPRGGKHNFVMFRRAAGARRGAWGRF